MDNDERSKAPAVRPPARERYDAPVLQRFGAAAEVTQRVSMGGLPDGGPGGGSMSRTG
jgi:hypothetical protein